MRVGQLSLETGASVRAIRHYESSGLLRAMRRANGYREFDDGAIERVRVIRELVGCGFTLDEIRSLSVCLFSPATDPRERCGPRTAALYRRKLDKIDGQLQTLARLRARLESRLADLPDERERA